MIILQMFPVAVTCGNTFILKPSEKDPGNSDLLLGSATIEHYLLHDTMNYIILEKGFKIFFPLGTMQKNLFCCVGAYSTGACLHRFVKHLGLRIVEYARVVTKFSLMNRCLILDLLSHIAV